MRIILISLLVSKYWDETWAIGILSPVYCYSISLTILLFRYGSHGSSVCLKQVAALFRNAWLWGRVGGRGGWQQQTFHTTPPRGRGESRACSNSTFIKTYWRKQHAGLWQEEEKISMTAGFNLPLTMWRLVPLSFHECFIFSSQCSYSIFLSSFHLPSLLPTTVAQTAVQPSLLSPLL